MIPVYYDPKFLDHVTGNHPECSERLRGLLPKLETEPLKSIVSRAECTAAPLSWITAVHSPEYVATIERLCRQGGGWLDSDTRLSPGSFEAAIIACGAACQAVAEVVEGKSSAAFCAVRPPGHHAESSGGMGFCLFNNVAVAAQFAVKELRLNRVLVVDWDVHHGNGTQEIFWTRPDVGFLSIHRFPFYPGTGTAGETGAGDGLGATLNLPIAHGTPTNEYLTKFRQGVEQIAQRIKPELILISAGFDAFRDDPIGSLGLKFEDFKLLTEIVLDISRSYCPQKVVSVLEGGYHLTGLANCVEAHLLALAHSDR